MTSGLLTLNSHGCMLRAIGNAKHALKESNTAWQEKTVANVPTKPKCLKQPECRLHPGVYAGPEDRIGMRLLACSLGPMAL